MAPPQQAAQENATLCRIRSSAVKWSHHYRLKTHSMGAPGDERKLSSLAPPAIFCEWVLFMRLQDSLSCLFLHQYKEPKAVFILGSVGFSGQWSSQHRERHKNIEMLFHLRTSFFLTHATSKKIKESGEVERGKGAGEWNILYLPPTQSP